ncbi:BZ3500_MvSof-1268-A1-R1_Chr4-4g07435 [Microbotryum saponariae]|uniref:BZ3500_MvSof-1268-A1-R1_Chr4-4g07435 protein n=1 Tax=Microbotryum saponariae TaxID=289078 RepID=A0A2X0KRE1_9BASI|nr:BZ3500_MvSof-1268-A1-R1_Chr4-4g07435 [Microbotryum saponariae]SDA07096.1 BZ3501_MvSof-1269-A2-R1_Chr4-3g07143 [Microbotryum saponariae]
MCCTGESDHSCTVEPSSIFLTSDPPETARCFFLFFTGAHKLQSFGLAGTARKRAKRGYKATTASNWVKVKPLRAKSAAQIKTRRAPNADSNGR